MSLWFIMEFTVQMFGKFWVLQNKTKNNLASCALIGWLQPNRNGNAELYCPYVSEKCDHLPNEHRSCGDALVHVPIECAEYPLPYIVQHTSVTRQTIAAADRIGGEQRQCGEKRQVFRAHSKSIDRATFMEKWLFNARFLMKWSWLNTKSC